MEIHSPLNSAEILSPKTRKPQDKYSNANRCSSAGYHEQKNKSHIKPPVILNFQQT